MTMELHDTHARNFSVFALNIRISDDLLTDAVAQVFQWFLLGVLCQVINIFGLVTNIMNIICFIKQGFRDPVSVSLTGLAISDIGCLITLTWTNICFTPAFITAELPFDSKEFQHLTGGMPHVTFTRISSWITAFITLERCLCITMPLKVREILTKKRVTVFIICMFLVLMTSGSPLYVVNRLGMKYFPLRNKSLIGLIHANNRQEVESISYTVNNVVVPGGAFVVIIVCTLVLVVHLGRATSWRKKSVFNEQAEKLSSRNQSIAKMVLMISTLFICCFFPVSVIFLAMSVVPELSLVGRYRNVYTVVGGCGVVLESVNSSVNIVIYYSMSSKFRVAFREICIYKCVNKSYT